jgi:hypothetical protein
MKKTLIPLFLSIMLICGCKKKTNTFPVFTLQYQSSKGNYSQSETMNVISTNFPLTVTAFASNFGNSSADSISISYASILRASGGMPFAQVQLNHTYAKNLVDSVNNQWVTKNTNDFYNIFNNNFKISSPFSGSDNTVNLSLRLAMDTVFYSFQNNYADTANHFEIIETSSYWLDWYYLMENSCNQPNCGINPVLVSARFSGKLTNPNPPYDTLVVSNGFFQGMFVDR